MSVRKGRKHKRNSHTDALSIDFSLSEHYNSTKSYPIVVYTRTLYYVGSSLNRDKNLLLVYGIENQRLQHKPLRAYMLIFTLEGYQVTRYLCQNILYDYSPVSVHFESDSFLVLTSQYFPFNSILIYTDYISELSKNIDGILFACHKSGDIYNTGKQHNSISIFSSDFQLKGYFKLTSSEPKLGFIVALMIEGDVLIVLVKYCEKLLMHPNFERRIVTPECKLHRYCLRTGELLKLWTLTDMLSYRNITNVCCTDKFTNVLLDCDRSTGYCVWSRNGRINYYTLKGKKSHREVHNALIGCSLTDNLQLICVIFSGGFKIHTIL